MSLIPVRRSVFATADYISIPQLEEIAKAVMEVIENPRCNGFGEVRLVIERGKIAGVRVLTSQRLLEELM